MPSGRARCVASPAVAVMPRWLVVLSVAALVAAAFNPITLMLLTGALVNLFTSAP